MIRIILFLLVSCLSASAQSGKATIQSGNVTPGHATCWTTNGIVQDCGTAAIPFLTSIGTVGQGQTICAWSALSTAPGSQKICLGVSDSTGASLVIQNFGIDTPQPFSIVLNGTTYQFPYTVGGIVGPNSSTLGDIAVWNNNAGSLLSDPASIAPNQALYFGSGRPWVDVRSGRNGCAAAAGNGSTDDSGAIQCQINFLQSTFGGGILYFPPGNYHVSTTVTFKGNVFAQGVGLDASSININTDITAVAFDATSHFAGMDKMTVFGNQTGGATANLVTVANGSVVIISNCEFSGGNWALANNGVDGNISNTAIQGFGSSGGGVLSQGANTYYDAKIDTSAATLAAFKQGPSYDGTTKENRIISSDMSGNYTDSLIIADTNNTSVMFISSTVMSAAISITAASSTMLSSDELGSTTLNAVGKIIIANSIGTSGPITVNGGAQSCAGNTNIVCNTTPSILSVTATGINFNSVADTAFSFTMPSGFTRIQLNTAIISNASHTLTTATFGVFTAAAAGGQALIASGTTITVSATADQTNNNMQQNNGSTTLSAVAASLATPNTLYFRVTNAEGTGSTGDVTLLIKALP